MDLGHKLLIVTLNVKIIYYLLSGLAVPCTLYSVQSNLPKAEPCVLRLPAPSKLAWVL